MDRKVRGMILAAGLGTRLRPLTYFRAKAAIPFLNSPFVSYSLELFRKSQIEPVMINLHHLPDTVRSVVGREAADVEFSVEEEILGTAGCLRKVREFFGNRRFAVSNGKTYFEQDLGEVLDHHDRNGAMVTMVLVPYRPEEPYNPVLVDADGNILGFARSRFQNLDRETRTLARPFIYTGVQILEPEVLDWIPPGASDSVNDIYPGLIDRGFPIRSFVSKAYWCECSTPRRYLEKSVEVLRRRHERTSDSAGLPERCEAVVLGEGVDLPADAVVEDSIFWGHTKVGTGSSFRNVIITDGVGQLPDNTHVRNAVITPIRDDQQEFRAVTRVGDRYALWPLD